jgi:hypothetical protein
MAWAGGLGCWPAVASGQQTTTAASQPRRPLSLSSYPIVHVASPSRPPKPSHTIQVYSSTYAFYIQPTGRGNTKYCSTRQTQIFLHSKICSSGWQIRVVDSFAVHWLATSADWHTRIPGPAAYSSAHHNAGPGSQSQSQTHNRVLASWASGSRCMLACVIYTHSLSRTSILRTRYTKPDAR